jgi:DNA-binding GntR family transcriptional regulator
MAITKAPATKTAKLVKTSLAELAYEQLKRQILDQRLQPGTRLNIDALSREFGISSSPLREALTRLGSEGLVAFAANAGFSVAPVPEPRQITQMLEFRAVIEAHCARVGAARAGAETVAAMKNTVDAMDAIREKGLSYKHYRAYLDLEQSFHQQIVDSAGNDVISAAYRDLHLILSVARLSVVPESNAIGSDAAVREHRGILRAFEKRDSNRAEQAVRAHIEAAKTRIKPWKPVASEGPSSEAPSGK